ncbi:MAG: glycosyltransferase family 2 protein [Coriobacteriaceae bacterium]|nr:MAG: glycosyltransferase family 2 protein [Coriobacteriaceae bacterium]
MKVLLIIPAYNEEASILGVVRSIERAGYDYVVIIDGATDRTLEICKDNGLNYINLPINMGIGGAVQTGHMYALRNGYDIDIQVDGDGQHDITYVPALVKAIQNGADLAIGSRFMEQTDGFQSSSARRAGINWLKRGIKHVTGLTIYDSTSGFRASGRRAIELFAKSYPSDYPEPESIVAAYNHGLTVREVPVKMRERQGGKSSINFRRSIYYMIKVTLAIWIEGHRNK